MAGYSVTVVRDQRDFFSDRRDFFNGADLVGGARFCQVVERMVRGRLSTTESRGMPWVTPVLGSGCLAVGGSEDVNPAEVRCKVVEAVAALLAEDPDAAEDSDYEIEELAEMAGRFSESLAQERLIGDLDSGEPTVGAAEAADKDAGVVVTAHAAHALLAATLLNGLYHSSKAHELSPPARGSDDSVSWRSLPDKRLRAESREQCDRLQTTAHVLKDSDEGAAVWSAIHSLLQEIIDDFTHKKVSLRKVGLLSEVAWFLLMRESGVYPGWNDLLFELMLLDDKQTEASERPWFMNLAQVGQKARALFALPTQRSWTDRSIRSPHGSGVRRVDFFDAVAELLNRQAVARLQAANRRKLPVATAFVTSFDIELEMSLHDVLAESQSIYVVCPVQVLPDDDSQRAKLCWVRARLDRPHAAEAGTEQGLERLLHPTSWDVVSPNLEEHFDEPHVIHLAGCPLLELPDNDGAPGFFKDLALRLTDQGMEFDPGLLVLSHAAVVDEYLALQQSEAELLWAVVNKSEPDSSLALPALFTGSDTAGGDSVEVSHPRFWMALGVPLDDPAVRNRVITQLTIRRLQPKIEGTAQRSVMQSPTTDRQPVGLSQDSVEEAPSDLFGGMAAAFDREAPAVHQPELKHVFVSYSSKDQELADRVVAGLKAAEIPCWVSSDDVPPGAHYAGEISSAIETAGALLLIHTPNSDSSKHVANEQELAIQFGLGERRFLLAVDGFTAESKEMQYYTASQQRSEVSSGEPCIGTDWTRLVQQLSATIGVVGSDADADDGDSTNDAAADVDDRGVGHLVGVVVNRRVSRDDAGMLHWLGLDVVCDDAADFADDIRHLADHLSDSVVEWRLPETKPCAL